MATRQQETKPEPAGTSPETRWRKKPVVVTAITFDELVAHGIASVPAEQLHNGVPWSFDYKGHPITHETDDCYLIPVLGGTVRLERGDMLVTGVEGELYPCKPDIFAATYQPSALLDDEAAEMLAAIGAELQRARGVHGPVRNAHEALGVIREEYVEFEQEVFKRQWLTTS